MNQYIIDNQYNIAFLAIKKILENGQTTFNIRGTGLILKDKKLITCAHVYNEIPRDLQASIFCGATSQDQQKGIKNYNSYSLKLLTKDDVRDIAVFEIVDKEDKLISHGTDVSVLMNEEEINSLKPTMPIYFVGFPLANEFLGMGIGLTLMASSCIIGALKYNNKDQKIDFLLLDKSVNPGNSGSPVFYNERIIGLASGTINQTQKIGGSLVNIPTGVGIVRTSNYVLDLLDALGESE